LHHGPGASQLKRPKQDLFDEIMPRVLAAARRNFAGHEKSWVRILRHLAQAVARLKEPKASQYFRAVISETIELISGERGPAGAVRKQIAFGQPPRHVRV